MSNKPCVIRDTAMGAFRSSLEDEAFARREIELEGAIDRAKAMDTIRAMRFLAEENSEKPITLLINSEGGSVVDGLAIFDTMRALPCPVRTICAGEASSMAAVILAGGSKGNRFILPNAQVMIHDPILTGCGGPALTVDAISQRLMRTRKLVAEIMAECTGKSVEEILEKTAKDTFFTADEAVEYGLVDSVIKTWGGDMYAAG